MSEGTSFAHIPFDSLIEQHRLQGRDRVAYFFATKSEPNDEGIELDPRPHFIDYNDAKNKLDSMNSLHIRLDDMDWPIAFSSVKVPVFLEVLKEK